MTPEARAVITGGVSAVPAYFLIGFIPDLPTLVSYGLLFATGSSYVLWRMYGRPGVAAVLLLLITAAGSIPALPGWARIAAGVATSLLVTSALLPEPAGQPADPPDPDELVVEPDENEATDAQS